ncbi:MAG: AraC family transcriptional regulator ligand-binding domain-containing protein [Halioglobus sp.]
MTGINAHDDWGLNVEWLVDYLADHGVHPAEIASQLPESARKKTISFLPVEDYLHLFAWASIRLGRPHLGLDISGELQHSNLGIYGYLINHSPNVGAMLEAVVRYQSIFMRGMGYTMLVLGGRVEMHWDIYHPACEGVRLDVEFTLASLVRLLHLKLGNAATPLRASFRHSCVSPPEKYQESFGCECSFDQGQNCLVFKRELLQVSLPGSDPKLLSILKAQADHLVAQWEGQNSFLNQVKLLITTSLEHTDSGMESLARQLNVTPRTLGRRLAKECTCYQELCDEIRIQAAKKALAESDAPVTVIAGKLGFSESSAFVRSFKRVVGTTPSVYRAESRRETP